MGGACSRAMRNAYTILLGNLKGRDHFGDLAVRRRIILRRLLKQQDVMV
jgi:hypothetical protein